MNEEHTYQQFLTNKLKDQHLFTQLIIEQNTAFKQKNIKLLRDITVVRRSQNELKLRMRQIQEKLVEQQMEIKKLKETRFQKTKQVTEKRKKQQAESVIDNKQIFKMYLENTFPKYKGVLKKIMKFLFFLQESQGRPFQKKIQFYRLIVQKGLKRFLDWLFPRQPPNQNKKQLAQTIVSQWKEKEMQQESSLHKKNLVILKEAEYIKQIQSLESQILQLHSSNKLLLEKINVYDKCLQIKGGEITSNLKKMFDEHSEYSVEAKKKVEETIGFFKDVIHLSRGLKDQQQEQRNNQSQIPLNFTDTVAHSTSKKKSAPILKKNIYGYYQDPQFAGNYTLMTATKHANLNKFTQTLPEDLCVLTLHPVIMVTLIDANIKPQRTRHSLQHYIRIRVNQQKIVDSIVKEGLQIIWNQPFLLKDYDFPFINVEVMHKTKGLRDYALGRGKFLASSEQQKIVNARKDKQFIGRVRFSLTYPKGNIYQFRITSVLLEVPSQKYLLKEQVNFQFPFNALLSFEFNLPERIIYTDKSVIILQNCENIVDISLPNQKLQQSLSTKQFTGKEGTKEIVVVIDNEWKVIIQGEIFLIICQDTEPQRIAQDLINSGKGKFFSVRAPPPITTVTYDKITLDANIKFPLVFQLVEPINRLSIVRQQSNRQLKQQIVDEILNVQGQLKLSDFIKAPGKIYKFFIETIKGEKVLLKHQNHLFERLLKDIHLQISYREDEIQQISYARKGNPQKEKLYKQFVIETKQLMLNHYRVFSRYFKRIGFVKFKLGYTIYDNLLLTESERQKTEEEQPQPKPMPQPQLVELAGNYFLYLELSVAHLSSQSNGSSYSCKLNGQFQSKKISGNGPEWKQGFTFIFRLENQLSFELKYEVIEHTTFSSKVIYSGETIINQTALQLGMLAINLDQKGLDCLHFSNISIPASVFSLNIQSIEAEIEEQADWIGKIDPYLTIHSKNRQLLKTNYLDNIGAHPVWQKINKQYFISGQQQVKQESEQIVTLQIKDYDLIGRDDYIGQVVINTKLNPEFNQAKETQVLFGNIVKENQVCGSLKIKGRFIKLLQKQLVFKEKMGLRLQQKMVVYRLVLCSLSIDGMDDFKGDKGYLLIKNQQNIQNERKQSFIFGQKNTLVLDLVVWSKQLQQYTFIIQRQQKSYFSKPTIFIIGSFRINVSDPQFIFGTASVVNQSSNVIGSCQYFVEIQRKTKYAALTSSTCCKEEIKIKSDMNDEILLPIHSKSLKAQSDFIFYEEGIHIQSSKEEKNVEGNLKEIQNKKHIFKVISPLSQHKTQIGCIKLEKELIFSGTINESSRRQIIEHDRQFKQIKYLYWEPFKFRQDQEYKFSLKCNQQDCFQFSQKAVNIYNDYVILRDREIPLIFDSKHCPQEIIISNKSSEKVRIELKEDICKMFVPNKGVLYYHLENYNHRSILDIRFSYLFIKVKNKKAVEYFKDISVHLSTALSIKSFSCSAIYKQQCFALQNISLILADPSESGTLFFDGYLQGIKHQDNKRSKIMNFKFGLRIQNNKEQYRFAESEDIVVHSLFKSYLIQRNYQPPAIIDNTIYGMSFIQLQSIEFEISQNSIDNQVFVDFQLNNQFEKIFLQRQSGSNTFKAELRSTYFIQSQCQAKLTLQEKTYFSQSSLGCASIAITSAYILKQKVSLHREVKKQNVLIGKINLTYINKSERNFVDVNLFSYISKSPRLNMRAQLQEFGPNKQKYQAISLTSRGNVPRLQSEDSFIIQEDPRNFQINVSDQDSKKLLGQFKLCHELQKVGDKVTALQPLRTSSDSLNGLLIIEYQMKKSKSLVLQKMKNTKVSLIQFKIYDVTFEDKFKLFDENISVNLKTANRNVTAQINQKGKPFQQKPISFTLCNTQMASISLMKNFQIAGTVAVNAPYFHQQKRILIFQKGKTPIGVCCLEVEYITRSEHLKLNREIVSVQATELMDTEFFAKMKPYVIMKSLNNEEWPCYVSQLGLGKENIYWQLNLITQEAISFIIFDKDMLFDDLIGNAVLPANTTFQTEERIHEFTLTSKEGENRKGGNGKIKIVTQPVQNIEGENPTVLMPQIKRIEKYLLRLGGLSQKLGLLLDNADEFEISIASLYNKYCLFAGKYNYDLSFYLQNKDLQIEFDTSFLSKETSCYIIISVAEKKKVSLYQIINLSLSQKPQSTQIFSIYQLSPLKTQGITLNKICFWLFDALHKDIQIFVSTKTCIQKMKILSIQQNLIVVQPFQLFQLEGEEEVNLLISQRKQEVIRTVLGFNTKISVQNIFSGSVINKKGKQLGKYYVQLSCFYSQGTEQKKKNYIGKSKKQWLYLNIIQAHFIKDIQYFSKMDPYCNLSLTSPKIFKKQWQKTSVQQDVGQDPVWNQCFFFPIDTTASRQTFLNIVAMDEEAGVDVMIADCKIEIDSLIKDDKSKEIKMYRKGEEFGTLLLTWQISVKYLIIRHVQRPNLQDNEEKIFLFHENNPQSLKGKQILEGMPYPLIEGLPITLKYGKTKRSFTFLEMKQKAYLPIIFQDEFTQVYYEIFD